MNAATAEKRDEGTVWLKATDKSGGITYTEHRCWHIGQFVSSVHAAAIKEGGKVMQITRGEYQKATSRH